MLMKIDFKEEMSVAKRHPLAYGSFINLMKLLIKNGGVDSKYFIRTIFISLLCCRGIPIRFFEKAEFGRQVKDVHIQYPPIFIIGHWRSGTTYLHNLITQDQNFGYVTTLQAWAPEMFFSIRKIHGERVNKKQPIKRPQDNVSVSMNSPQEEEFALLNISPYSFYQGIFFEKNLLKHLRETVIFAEDSKEIKQAWVNAFTRILKKTCLSCNGKRIVLKNPTNTARVKLLLEMFPDAKFIHIYRNPYVVYASMKHLFKSSWPELRLQDIDEEEADKNILKLYQEIMQKFFAEKNMIPATNLIEIKYEDFVGNELTGLRRIYEQFNSQDFEKAEGRFKTYLDSLSTYKTNKHVFDRETIEKVYESWKFSIDRWNYGLPE